MINIFLTGGNGYVGRYLVPKLIRESYNLKLLLLGDNPDKFIDSDRINPIHGDIRNKDLLFETIAGSDAVIHLASIVGSYSLTENMEINYEGTKNLIKACNIHGIKRFIYISSVSAARQVQGPYGQSKKLAEDAVIASGLDYTILRTTTVMGRESLGLNRIIKNINRFKHFIPMVGLGCNTRHPVYIADFISLIEKSIVNKITYEKLYEVGGERIIQFRELVQLVNQKLGNKRKIILPIPKKFVRLVAFFLERILSPPPFAREHVNALGEHTNMNTNMIKEDLDFQPTPLNDMLDIIIEEIRKDPPNLL